MKTIITAAICLFASFAFADQSRDNALDWAQSFFQKATPIPYENGSVNEFSKKKFEIKGTTCTLLFTFDPDGPLRYIVVGDDTKSGPDSENDRYIGMSIMPDTKIETRGITYIFERSGTWNQFNRTQYNRVLIDVRDGKPAHVTGVSDKQTIHCDLN